VAPTDSLPVVRYDLKAGQRSLDMLRWGLIPYWAKDIKVGFANINEGRGDREHLVVSGQSGKQPTPLHFPCDFPGANLHPSVARSAMCAGKRRTGRSYEAFARGIPRCSFEDDSTKRSFKKDVQGRAFQRDPFCVQRQQRSIPETRLSEVSSMGEKAWKKRLFLAKHPLCCFCGGIEPSVTEDHVPARSFLAERRWPEGYVFPSCAKCNAATRLDEQVCNFLSRCYSVGDRFSLQEFNSALTGLINNHPGILQELVPDLLQTGRLPTRLGLPVIRVDGPQVRRAVENYARKLFSALHYKETGRILPHAGGIAWLWWSNAETPDFPESFVERFRRMPELKRQKDVLIDQFRYRCTVTEEGKHGMYLVGFREAFNMVGLVAFDSFFLMTNKPPEAVILRPLRHQ